MNQFLQKIITGLDAVKDYLIAYGPFGLFAIALLDSMLVPLPGGVDAGLIILTAARPAWLPFYVASATLGSVLGCVVLYYISRRAGGRALARFPQSKQARVKELIDRYDVLSVLIASILPPPFPFKLFVITGGVFRLNVLRFTIAITAGRAFRFLLEGYLAARYGVQAWDLFKQYYPAAGLSLALLIILVFIIRGLWQRKTQDRNRVLEASE